MYLPQLEGKTASSELHLHVGNLMHANDEHAKVRTQSHVPHGPYKGQIQLKNESREKWIQEHQKSRKYADISITARIIWRRVWNRVIVTEMPREPFGRPASTVLMM